MFFGSLIKIQESLQVQKVNIQKKVRFLVVGWWVDLVMGFFLRDIYLMQ